MEQQISTGRSFLKIHECARIARCSAVTLRRAIKAKRLSCVKPNGKMGLTLVSASALQSYLVRGTQFAITESAMTTSYPENL